MLSNQRKKKQMNEYSKVKIHRNVSDGNMSDYIEYNQEEISLDNPLYYIDGTVILKNNDMFFVAMLNHDYIYANITGPMDFETCLNEFKKINKLFDIAVRFGNNIENVRILIGRDFDRYRMEVIIDDYSTFFDASKYEDYLHNIFREEYGCDVECTRSSSTEIIPTPYGTSISRRFEIRCDGY